MNKRQYFYLIEEYESLLKHPRLNPLYSESERLNEVRERLCVHLFQMNKQCAQQLRTHLCRMNRLCIEQIHWCNAYTRVNYTELKDLKLCLFLNQRICEAVKNGESIKPYDYRDSYIANKIYGITIKRLFIVMITIIFYGLIIKLVQ